MKNILKTASIARMVVRIAGLIQLILGFIIWLGNADSLFLVHIIIGSLLVVALLTLSYLAARSKIPISLMILAVVWALVLPVWGLIQEKLLPGTGHWIIQVLHLLCGVGAIGMAEMLSAQIRKKSASPAH
jgi:hypothetical protein